MKFAVAGFLLALLFIIGTSTALKCRSCEGMQCLSENDWITESCSDQREQECFTLSRPDGDGKTYRMGCTHHSCRHLRDGRDAECTKCDNKNYCNEDAAIGVSSGSRSGGGGSNRQSSGGGGVREGDGLGDDYDNGGSGGGSNQFGGSGGGGSSNGGGSQRQNGDGNGRESNSGFGSGRNVNNGGTGGGSNQFGGTGGGGSGGGGNNVQWSHRQDHGNYEPVADTEDVYHNGRSGVIGSRYCYTCRGEQCRNKADMNRQLCKEGKFETCYAVHDTRNGTTHEMGCTHYTCTLLKAYVDSNVCEKCTGDFCNHQLWKYREGQNNEYDNYFF